MFARENVLFFIFSFNSQVMVDCNNLLQKFTLIIKTNFNNKNYKLQLLNTKAKKNICLGNLLW